MNELPCLFTTNQQTDDRNGKREGSPSHACESKASRTPRQRGVAKVMNYESRNGRWKAQIAFIRPCPLLATEWRVGYSHALRIWIGRFSKGLPWFFQICTPRRMIVSTRLERWQLLYPALILWLLLLWRLS